MQINNKKAESFVEVIVATVLLVILSAFLFSSFMSRKKTVITAGHRTEAKNFARAKIEEFAAEKYSEITASANSSDVVTFGNGGLATREWAIAEETVDGFTYKKLTVKMSWDEG